MAIQDRRGAYEDFDPQKMLPGEWATVLSGDPNAADGRAVYKCFEAGKVKRMATYEDMVDNIEQASGEVVDNHIKAATEEVIQECETATENADSAAEAANQTVQEMSNAMRSAEQTMTQIKNDANAATTAANAATSNANTATANANAAAEAANKAAANNTDVSFKTVDFLAADARYPLTTGNTVGVLMSRIAKWLLDLKDAAFASIANNLTTETPGSALDACQGAVLNKKITALHTDFIKSVRCDYSLEIAAGSSGSFNPVTQWSASIPEGYTCVGILDYALNSGACFASNLRYADSAYGIQIRNIGTSSVTANVTCYLLCIKEAT